MGVFISGRLDAGCRIPPVLTNPLGEELLNFILITMIVMQSCHRGDSLSPMTKESRRSKAFFTKEWGTPREDYPI